VHHGSPLGSSFVGLGRLLSFLVVVLLSFASAQGFDARARTVTVAPSGGDDTLAIRQAFATCAAVGPGCTVRLAEGTFFTRQHVIEGFHGSFVGAGTDRTVIEPLAPLYVTGAEMVLMNHPTDEEPWPILFLFVDAHMTMSDLTFRVTDYEVTTPWNIYGMEITALATLVSLTGVDVRVDVARIAMESDEGSFFGVSVINGIFVQGVLPGPSGGFGDRPPFTGTVTVRDSRFIGPDGGISIGNLDGATVSVRDSVFEGVFSVFADDLNDSFVEIANNDIATAATAIDLSAGVHKTQTAPSRVVIAGNTLGVPVGAQGVVLADMGDAPTLQVWLVDNVFELDGAVAGIGGFAQGVVVRDNLMRGTASAGVRVGALPEDDAEEPPPAATGWMVAANDLSELEAELADIWLTEEAREAVVVCGGSVRVLDEGVGSRVICD
jgi:hypothetical protein